MTVRRAPWRVAAVAAIACVGAVTSACDDGTAASRTTAPVAQVRIAGVTGGEVSVVAAQRPLVLSFVAAWCAPCRRELPGIEALHRSLGTSVDFVAVGVNEDPAATAALVADTGLTFPVGSDPDGELFASYGFTGLPATVVFDSAGKETKRFAKMATADELRPAIEAALDR